MNSKLIDILNDNVNEILKIEYYKNNHDLNETEWSYGVFKGTKEDGAEFLILGSKIPTYLNVDLNMIKTLVAPNMEIIFNNQMDLGRKR